MLKSIIGLILCLVLFASGTMVFADFSNGTAQTMKIEGEWFSESNTTLNKLNWDANASGGLIAQILNTEAPPVGGYFVGYDVAVSKAGIYELIICANRQGQKIEGGAGLNTTSPYKLRVNGEVLSIAPHSYAPSQTLVNLPFYSYKINVALNKGVNNIRFIVEQGRLSNGNYLFNIDYFTLKYASNHDMRIEAEVFSLEGTLGSATASEVIAFPSAGGDTILSHSRGLMVNTEHKPKWSYQTIARTTGEYRMEIVCYALGQTWSSDFNIKINGGEAIPMNMSNTGLIDLGNGFSSTDAGVRKYKLINTVNLEKGLNEIEIEIDELTGTKYKTIIDYIDFIKAGTDGFADVIIEGESYTGSNFGGAPGTNFHPFSKMAAKSFIYSPASNAPANKTATYNFYISREGEYDLYVDMTSQLASPNATNWISPVGISIDGIDLPTINTTSWTKLGPMGNLDANTYSKNKKNEKVYLSEGNHTIAVTVLGPSTNIDRYYFVLDKIEFVAQKIPGKLSADVSNPVVAKNQTTQANGLIYSNYGELVPMGDYTVTYSSADINIAEVDAITGVITGRGIGTTQITANCDIGDGTILSDTVGIKVIGEGGIDIGDWYFEENSINIRSTSWLADSEAAFVVAVRDKVGSINSLTECKIINKTEWYPGISSLISIPLQNVSAESEVKVLVWNNMNLLKPHWLSIDAQ